MNTWMCTLQNSNSPICDSMLFFHDFAMLIMTFINVMVLFIIVSLFMNKLTNRKLLQGHTIELIWTIIPMIILILIAIPSLKLLYQMDEMNNHKMTVKCIGHQWYWSYEYPEFTDVSFDSYMIELNDLDLNGFRLLDVDHRCVLPYMITIRLLTSSMDVIHSWSVPCLGVKMDSTPGRLNQTFLYLYRPGLYYGQCSEICGMNHSFMPTVIEATSFKEFMQWVLKFMNN